LPYNRCIFAGHFKEQMSEEETNITPQTIPPIKPAKDPKIKKLYPYQHAAIGRIFDRLQEAEQDHNLLFQLPTGGGKTVIFSEIAKRFITTHKKKVLILTHRIELSVQTANVLIEVGIPTKIINSHVKSLADQAEFTCFVAMVETLNNRLQEDDNYIEDIGLVIVDEAHYNSFRKIFQYFKKVNILGVTATPLSSNKTLPLNDNYDELLVGESIRDLVDQGYLADATTFTYSVNLRGLKVGISGDFTVSSSERVYSNYLMQDRLLGAYEEKAKGTKTLIFNSGIDTSKRVEQLFRRANYPIRHLDSTFSDTERQGVIDWFKNTDDGILTSVGILTHGFDEPSVRSIILNRATRSLTLYHQMIGRGSRIMTEKSAFNVIDLGNNAFRLGLWQDFIDWQDAFRYPDRFLEKRLKDEEEYQYEEEYLMPSEIARRFPTMRMELEFSIKESYEEVMSKGQKPQTALEASVENHAALIKDNAEDLWDGFELQKLLQEEIEHRLKQYLTCISKSTDNYFKWLLENYNRKLKQNLRDVLDY
jgi:superfamily II DNA or RNA helicase